MLPFALGNPEATGLRRLPARGVSGFTIIEMLSVVMIIAILAGLGLPKLQEATKRAKIARAIGEIDAIQWDLMALEAQNQPLPPTLAGIGRGGMVDPWGYPYVYFPFPANQHGNGHSGARRDRFLVPVNSTFDLYSVGPDGQSSLPFTASSSHDDIVRANDGGFIGLASEF
jgi:general secretion pathway protein G